MMYLTKPRVYLPPPRYGPDSQVFRKKTLIFDLDETLVHCLDQQELFSDDVKPDIIIPIPICLDEDDAPSDMDCVDAEFMVRPHLMYCLEELSRYY